MSTGWAPAVSDITMLSDDAEVRWNAITPAISSGPSTTGVAVPKRPVMSMPLIENDASRSSTQTKPANSSHGAELPTWHTSTPAPSSAAVAPA